MRKGNLTTAEKRIETIDVLRGFALAGILYAHMIFWYTGAALPPAEYFKYDSFVDNVAFAIFGGLVFGKFFSVFSFLFGLSFYLHFRKKEAGGGAFFQIYLWRLFLLFLMGIVHHTLWRGDILAIYAILGVLLLAFRRLPDKYILITSLLLIVNFPSHVYDLFEVSNADSEVTFPMSAEAKDYYSLIKNEGFDTMLVENWRSWPAKIEYQLESGRLLMTFGYFLLGLFAGRKRLFNDIPAQAFKFRKWNKTTAHLVLALLGIGLLMYLLNFVTLPELHIIPTLKWPASFLFSIYNACLTIFYITGITLLFRQNDYKKVLQPLAAMGKMALTNYLLQTFFGLLIFYQFGLGLFDQISPATNVLLGVIVFLLQLKFSQIWLKHYKQGPIEWLWKSLSYFKIS